MTTQEITPRYDEWKRVKDTEIAHLAGVLDAVGTVTVHISKSGDYSIGYHYQPTVRIIRPSDDDPLMGKLLAYCDENGIRYSLSEKSHGSERESTSFEWLCKNPESIRQFLEPMLPHLVTQYEKAVVMLEQIVPRIEDDLHQEQEGFLELMEFADLIRGGNRRGPETKYTTEYFENEWSVAE